MEVELLMAMFRYKEGSLEASVGQPVLRKKVKSSQGREERASVGQPGPRKQAKSSQGRARK